MSTANENDFDRSARRVGMFGLGTILVLLACVIPLSMLVKLSDGVASSGYVVNGPKGNATYPGDGIERLGAQDVPLIIEARVAPDRINQVHVGQPVWLNFSAFSSHPITRNMPELQGEVSSVSPTASEDKATAARFYNVRITVSTAEKDKFKAFRLVPGIQVGAYVLTGELSLMSLLARSVFGVENHS